MTTTPTSGAAIQRYKIGYHSYEWGRRSSTPSGIPDASGSWVRYADHVTALAAGQATAAPAQPAAQQGVAYAALPESFLEIPDVQDESGINAYYSREVVLECIDAALASHGQAPAATAFCWATELSMVREPVTLTVKEAREASDQMQRLHAASFKTELRNLTSIDLDGDQAVRLAFMSFRAASAFKRAVEAEIALLKRSLLDAEAAPQPSPAAQAAESVPAIQGERNVQLDIDSNHSAPGQQRDVARSVALGQPMGNGQDQAAGRPSAQEDKLLTVAERNIRSFLRSATFKSESDREAALNCVDVLWEAARDPADSVQEDAALWHWLAEYLVGTRTDLDDEIVASETVNDLRKLVKAAIKQGEKQ